MSAVASTEEPKDHLPSAGQTESETEQDFLRWLSQTRQRVNRRAVPAGPKAADVLPSVWRELGLPPVTQDEIDNLPPWTLEEAAAFERGIKESDHYIEKE